MRWMVCRSSRFGRLQNIKCAVAGKNLYMRFGCSTGDAMGMNMVSKGVQNVLDYLQPDFPDMEIIGISGKPSMLLNFRFWIHYQVMCIVNDSLFSICVLIPQATSAQTRNLQL